MHDDCSAWCNRRISIFQPNGATVAHIMAREGHKFKVEEIKALGNPVDAAGLTIADWMEKRESPLTDEASIHLDLTRKTG